MTDPSALRHRAALLLATGLTGVGLALTVTACGGSDNAADSTSTAKLTVPGGDTGSAVGPASSTTASTAAATTTDSSSGGASPDMSGGGTDTGAGTDTGGGTDNGTGGGAAAGTDTGAGGAGIQ